MIFNNQYLADAFARQVAGLLFFITGILKTGILKTGILKTGILKTGTLMTVTLITVTLITVTVVAQQPGTGSNEAQSWRPLATFDEIDGLVQEHFFDPAFDAEAWQERSVGFRQQAGQADSRDKFAAIVNDWLATLHSSHTHYYSRLDPKRYQLLSVFASVFESEPADSFVYQGIGIDTQQLDGKTCVTAVYDGLPADEAGLQFGDRILSVDGAPFHAIRSFLNRAGQTVTLEIERGGAIERRDVRVAMLDGRTMFHRALEASVRIVEHDGLKIGYLHAWSYASSKYHEFIRSTLLWGSLSGCDGLVLDLRDGWGGADINYLNLFREPIAEIRSQSRSSPPQNFTGVWGKPVTLLINSRSTSGKELFAYGFQKLGLGRIVGERSAGAVLAGRVFVLTNGDILYLAVQDIEVDGQRLEGQGIQPDDVVARPLPGDADFRPGVDPQLERAIEYLGERCRAPFSPGN